MKICPVVILLCPLLQYTLQTLIGNLWENVSLAVQYAPDVRCCILCFLFKLHSA